MQPGSLKAIFFRLPFYNFQVDHASEDGLRRGRLVHRILAPKVEIERQSI